jgi:hypothetical protein
MHELQEAGRQSDRPERWDELWSLVSAYWRLPIETRVKFARRHQREMDAFAGAGRRRLKEAVQTRSAALLKQCAIAIAAAGEGLDYRDRLCDIFLIWHAAAVLKIDGTQLFDQIAERCTPDIQPFFSNFPRRAEEDRSLAAFGYKRDPFVDPEDSLAPDLF